MGCGRRRRIEFVQSRIAGQRVEHLSAVGDIGDQRPNAGIVEPLGVDIEHLMAPLDEILDDMPSSFAAPAGEHNPLRHPVLQNVRFFKVRPSCGPSVGRRGL